jgi:hypothetical protein
MCLVCMSVVGSTEQEVLAHLLVAHPVALAILAGVLAVANVSFARRPRTLVALDLGVYLVAMLVSRGSFGAKR